MYCFIIIDQKFEHLDIILAALAIAFFLGFFIGKFSKSKKTVGQVPIIDDEIDLVHDISKIRAIKTFERGGKEMIKTVFKEESSALNFNRIGVSTIENKDNLKEIKGIGKEIELQLNSIGLFTFQQISNFNNKDIVKITKLLKFFPGRIERDDWVGQAFQFTNNKAS